MERRLLGEAACAFDTCSPSPSGSVCWSAITPQSNRAPPIARAFKAPTAEQERLIWAEATTGGTPVCFDSVLRTARSDTPTQCTVVDRREAGIKYRGPGPYQLEWLGAGPCSVTFEAPGGLTVTREYMPLP